ncbi:discoidin domain-containing protein [Capnocytophaga sp.]|uniref:discoidin domain-containing protein n=1 Tax=Capnocytophaga sp. TaxID=44737 RepID=UPI0026DBBA3D|nr:discoidin domain-containing protein [Capnocytophaga sp.]MDO5105661.1 discoidin domain-containing protein [Capnocytophaga sp.]
MLVASLTLVACKKDEPKINPSGIKNLQSEELPGQIKITWEKEEPVTFEHLRFTYFDKLTKKEVLRLASIYSNEIIIPNTRKKYGEYEFKIQPVSATGTEGQVYTFKATSGAAPATYQLTEGDDAVKVNLSVDMLETNAQEPSEGHIANLIDGNNYTYFHTKWSGSPINAQHYFQINLTESLQGFKFNISTRHNGNGSGDVKRMKVEASNDGETWVEVGIQTYDLASRAADDRRRTFNGNPILMNAKYSKLRFTPLARRNADPLNKSFFDMGEFSLFNEPVLITDPEAPAEGD